MGAPTKRARKIRTASEFDLARFRAELQAPSITPGAYAWALSEIISARNAQMAGKFKQPARLAESMRTSAALSVAYGNRLAPLRSLDVEMVAAKGARGKAIAAEGDALFGRTGVGVNPDTLRDIHGCLVNHSIAIGCNVLTPREDGSRIDLALKYWPIEHVWWDAYARTYKTQVFDGPEEIITHGDGRWVVFQEGEYEPFKNGAILAASGVWARCEFAVRDWAKSSLAHGMAKVVGEMPAGIALQNKDGITPEAAAMLDLLRGLMSGDCPVGIQPAGSKVDFVTNNSTNWQVFAELVTSAQKDAARIYLGTDGTLGAQGGAPGVDISQLFGVATTKVQGDRACIERGLQTGSIDVWAALNFGTSELAPKRLYKMPDADVDAVRSKTASQNSAFFTALKTAHDAGAQLSIEYINALADDYGVRPPDLKMPPTLIPVPSITTPSTDAPPAALRRVTG